MGFSMRLDAVVFEFWLCSGSVVHAAAMLDWSRAKMGYSHKHASHTKRLNAV